MIEVVHSWFVDLGDSSKVVVHYLLIGGMSCLGYGDEFPMVITLVCMVTHWIKPIVNHDISYPNTKLLCYIDSQA